MSSYQQPVDPNVPEPWINTPQKDTGYEGYSFDRILHAALGRFTKGLSPSSYYLAFTDWYSHIMLAPGKLYHLNKQAAENIIHLFHCAQLSLFNDGQIKVNFCTPKKYNNSRFSNKLWEGFPFNIFAQFFSLQEALWDEATHGIRGVSKHRQNVINFCGKQMLDMMCPSNYLFTNPEILKATLEQNGYNLFLGFRNFIDDYYNEIEGGAKKNHHYKVGQNLALTKGKVVYRNKLIELIQYDPIKKEVFAEPILFVPAWIMKYYILDLSEHNSMVKYLLTKGHTVFMISWKNPGSEDCYLSFEDYVNLGIMNAIEVIKAILPEKKIHTVGYCIGGTLLSSAVALLSHDNAQNPIKTLTLFATQVDFKEAGELQLFVDESQVSFLEDVMWEKGFLDGPQMLSTFSMLRSQDLIWSKAARNYLLGKKEVPNDLMAWDEDTTRLPYKVHSEYLRKLFLNNELSEGHFKINNQKVSLRDIEIPIFSVGTIKDHISPWRSVYKIHSFTNSDITFVLTSGGHNAGIISEPGHPRRFFRMKTKKKTEKQIGLEKWIEQAEYFTGSWWESWQKWLVEHSDKTLISAPESGCLKKGFGILCNAPGTYVYKK